MLADCITDHVPAMLLFVVDSLRSSPGRQGFFMAVNERGQMSGSIGGGIMEHKFVELAKERLKKQEHVHKIVKQVHDKIASHNQSGLICSGEQTIFIYTVAEDDLKIIKSIIDCITFNKIGSLEINPSGIKFINSVLKNTFTFENEQSWKYVQRLGYTNSLYIIGGGHCSLALSDIMRTLNFHITVMDERRDLHTMNINSGAQELKYIENYEKLADLIPEGDDIFVVIMTLGYRSDYIALKGLLDANVGYIGVLGSDTKIRKMFSDYETEGIEERILKTIHAPVGISIKSETPEEIAISIAAEIIEVKNNVLNVRRQIQ